MISFYYLSRIYIKKILSSLLSKILLVSYFIIFSYIIFSEEPVVCLNFLFALSPYLFLFFTSDMVKDEIERGYLDNRFLLLVSKSNLLKSKIIAIFLTGLLCFTLMYLFIIFVSFLRGSGININWRGTGISLLIAFYYTLTGLLLGFFLKGASNVLFYIIIQILTIGIWAKYYPEFFYLLEKGIFPALSEKLKFIAFLSIFPNFLLKKSLSNYIYILPVNMVVLFSLIEYLLMKKEIKRS